MIKKIIYVYKERGLVGTIASIINYPLVRIFGVRIVKSSSIGGNSKARSVFKGRQLKKSSHGYYYVNPMPTNKDLDSYYSNIYWDSRSGKKYGTSIRDFVHWHLLKKYIPDFFDENNKTFLNFGAGHGGVSNLFWFDGFNVVNVEPSQMPISYNSRWMHCRSISEVPESSVDLIYGSHSLEHVNDIENFKKEIKRILKPGGYVFWEVPNAECPTNGAMNNRIDIPHTYYFKREYFQSFFDEVIYNQSFDQTHPFGIVENWEKYENPKGMVTRTLGRFN